MKHNAEYPTKKYKDNKSLTVAQIKNLDKIREIDLQKAIETQKMYVESNLTDEYKAWRKEMGL